MSHIYINNGNVQCFVGFSFLRQGLMSHVHDVVVKISWYMKVSETVARKVRETERSNMTPKDMFSNLVSIIACLIFVCVGCFSSTYLSTWHCL
jgi:hypothetical protein